jgi:hypothetical protein
MIFNSKEYRFQYLLNSFCGVNKVCLKYGTGTGADVYRHNIFGGMPEMIFV